MKKLLMVLFVAFLVLGFAACNGDDTTETDETTEQTTEATEFKVDGEFMAFEIGEHYGAPMITSVTVTVEDGEIVDYFIDALQSDGETLEWNENTKKELGYDYKMHYNAYSETDDTPTMAEYETWLDENDKLEWFEQAELIEEYWLENGFDSVDVVDGEIDNVAGVTVSDGGYTTLAAEAVQQAKDGITKAYSVSVHYGAPQVVWATLDLDDNGDIEELVIDTLQSTVDEGTFAWNDNTKQELGYDYKMHYGTYSETDDTPTMAEYETWLEDNDKLEWFEQVNMITDYIEENGWESSFNVQDSVAGVTVTTNAYETVLEAVFAKVE
ncbi:MAG: hypothetical protein R6U15_02470 [Candidatus Izemoplasmatales bacterium]